MILLVSDLILMAAAISAQTPAIATGGIFNVASESGDGGAALSRSRYARMGWKRFQWSECPHIPRVQTNRCLSVDRRGARFEPPAKWIATSKIVLLSFESTLGLV